jgi:membrane protein DedA with SNARE-associated domain
MSLDTLTHLILTYRYWVLVPLSVLEGPIVALVAGTLASLGYFNIYFLVIFFFVRDMLMDAGYYSLGHFGGRTALVRRLLTRMGVTDEHLESVRTLWKKYPGRTMFIGKLSYGITSSFIVVAGIVQMPLKKFFGWGSLVAITQYGTLLLVGFFFGAAFGSKLSVIVENLQYAIAGASLLILGYLILTWRLRRTLFTETSTKE